MAGGVSRRTVTKNQADRVATEIMAGDASVQSLMILDNRGRILTHVRDDSAGDEEGIAEGLPSLIRLPGSTALVFLRLAPDADRDAILEEVVEAFGPRVPAED